MCSNGHPTGRDITSIKISSNSKLARQMPDIIDCDAGGVVRGEASIEEVGTLLLDHIIATASNRSPSKAEQLGQDDFIPWKRSLSF